MASTIAESEAAPGPLMRAFEAMIGAADPTRVVPPHLPAPPVGRTVVVGAGKAAAAMARAVEDHWPGPLEGLVLAPDGHGVSCRRIGVVEAAHPIPDARGQEAARRILTLVQSTTSEDLVIVLLSGGGSALLAVPAPGLSLTDKQALTAALLRSGAPIGAINTVRKHLSAIKGGRLACASAAPLVALAISDVPGDDLATIASGPTVSDPSTRQDALDVLTRYGITPPPSVARHLADPASETPKPGDPRLTRARTTVIARPREALQASAARLRAEGFRVVFLGDALEGEARDMGRRHGALALAARRRGRRAALLSGGELTVRLTGKGGQGGPNREYLLALAVALAGTPGIQALAGDSDGIDGTDEAAGAWIDSRTLARARAQALDPAAALAGHNSGPFFATIGCDIRTGPTRTNVNDFRCILIEPTAA